jgi:hypothetical protein
MSQHPSSQTWSQLMPDRRIYDDDFLYRSGMTEPEWGAFQDLVRRYEAQRLHTSLTAIARALIKIYLADRPDLGDEEPLAQAIPDYSLSRAEHSNEFREENLPELSDVEWILFMEQADQLHEATDEAQIAVSDDRLNFLHGYNDHMEYYSGQEI